MAKRVALDKDYLLELLELNFRYKVIKDKIFDKVLELDERTAYRFCLTTNSYYLIDKYGLRLFGRFRTFNHRNYSLNQGLFLIETSNGKIINNNLPVTLCSKYPFIYKGKKKVIFIDGNETSDIIAETFNKIVSNGGDYREYIVNIVHKDGSQWEHYFEFMASEIFIGNGYFTDIQLPWSYHGKPDFGIYKHQLLNILKSVDLIENGALILELSALRLFSGKHNFKNNRIADIRFAYEFLVGEVKTTQKKSQILEYLKIGLSFKGYEFIPDKKQREYYSGLIKIDSQNKIILDSAPINPYFDQNKLEKDLEWFECYLKIHLLGNLHLDELEELMKKITNQSELTFKNLIGLVHKIDFNEIVEVIENGL
jgi:hypothetical protein